MAVWLYRENLTVAFVDEPLAEYRVTYQPDRHRLKAVTDAEIFASPFRSPQLRLFGLNETEWLTILRVPDYLPRRARVIYIGQLPLFADVFIDEASS